MAKHGQLVDPRAQRMDPKKVEQAVGRKIPQNTAFPDHHDERRLTRQLVDALIAQAAMAATGRRDASIKSVKDLRKIDAVGSATTQLVNNAAFRRVGQLNFPLHPENDAKACDAIEEIVRAEVEDLNVERRSQGLDDYPMPLCAFVAVDYQAKEEESEKADPATLAPDEPAPAPVAD